MRRVKNLHSFQHGEYVSPEQHILDALQTMEKAGLEPSWDDWIAISELLEEEAKTDKAGSLPALAAKKHLP